MNQALMIVLVTQMVLILTRQVLMTTPVTPIAQVDPVQEAQAQKRNKNQNELPLTRNRSATHKIMFARTKFDYLLFYFKFKFSSYPTTTRKSLQLLGLLLFIFFKKLRVLLYVPK